MARKDVLKHVIEEAKSLASDFTTKATIVKYLDNLSYQINVATSNSTGVFAIQASNDYEVDPFSGTVTNPGSWADLPLQGETASPPSATAADDTIMISLNQVDFTAIRVSYTPTIPGTGVCGIVIVAKQVGG